MADRVEVLRHFSIPIVSALLEGFADRKAALVAELQALRAREPASVDLTNRGSWHSRQDLQRQDEGSPVRWALDRVATVARAALADLYDGFRASEPRIVEAWAVIGGAHAWHTPHHHYPRAWSGVLYVSAEHCVSSAPRDRGGKIEFLSPLAVPPAFFSAGSVAYDPKDGLALLFPAALSHLVHPNPTTNERIVMSFNLDVVPQSA